MSNKIKTILDSIKEIEQVKLKPYFYSRLSSKLEKIYEKESLSNNFSVSKSITYLQSGLLYILEIKSQIALKKAGNKAKGSTMYVTLEPCPMCAQAISFSRIRRLYFGAYDSKNGAVDHGVKIFSQKFCNHKPEIIGSLEEKKCSDILKEFFE